MLRKRNAKKSEKTVPIIFGDKQSQELLKSEDLCLEEEKSFMRYIGESSVEELIMDLKDIKKLLA